MIRIDLEQFLPEKLRFIGGEDLGYELRGKLELDKVDKGDESVEFVIGKKYFGVNHSFFYGLLYDSATILDREVFEEKYKVLSSNKDIVANFNENIDKIYNIKELLSKR